MCGLSTTKYPPHPLLAPTSLNSTLFFNEPDPAPKSRCPKRWSVRFSRNRNSFVPPAFPVPRIVPERKPEAEASATHERPLPRNHGKPQRVLHARLKLGAGKDGGHQGQSVGMLPAPTCSSRHLSIRSRKMNAFTRSEISPVCIFCGWMGRSNFHNIRTPTVHWPHLALTPYMLCHIPFFDVGFPARLHFDNGQGAYRCVRQQCRR